MDIVRVENLTKIYGKGETKVIALNNVSFKIKKGDFVIVLGKSGSGKSTLMHLLGGVDEPTSGKVFIGREDVYKLKGDKLTIFRRKNIGIIYQFYNLIPVLTVKENIVLPALLDGRKISDGYINEIINYLGLNKRVNHLPNELSGGQQQRVAVGRAIINHPKIILADEPTGNLDSRNSKQIMKLLKKYNDKFGQTVIVITHDQSLVGLGNRIITMADGKIIKDEKRC